MTVRARGSVKDGHKIVFWTWRGHCTTELMVAVAVCTAPEQDQDSLNSSMDWGVAQKGPTPS